MSSPILMYRQGLSASSGPSSFNSIPSSSRQASESSSSTHPPLLNPNDKSSSPLRRRLSIEEDVRYQQIMTSPRRLSHSAHPPPYSLSSTYKEAIRMSGHYDFLSTPYQDPHQSISHSQIRGTRSIADLRADTLPDMSAPPRPNRLSREDLPSYTCSVECEGVFERKMEIEHVTKRAENRQWHSTYITLVGTALTVYAAKKDRGLGKKGGPQVCPDNPPWIKRGKIIRQYSLMHADAGIAADYEKRRYVIRIRAETDQFLISCIELSTYIKWLNALFSAIDVAAPIEERDFPRDQSIPRYQRIRWLRGTIADECPVAPSTCDSTTNETPAVTAPLSSPAELRNLGYYEDDQTVAADETEEAVALAQGKVPETSPASDANQTSETIPSATPRHHQHAPQMQDPIAVRRVSHSEYPHDAVDYLSGKWAPYHAWTEAHDLLYAKMCYSVLMFRSPRKSQFVISGGTKWQVDWQTGKMTRVLPPDYSADPATPWELLHTQNMRRR